MGIIEAIGQAFKAFASIFGFASKRSDLANTKEMQANARAKTDAEIKNSAINAVAKGDLDEIRKQASSQ